MGVTEDGDLKVGDLTIRRVIDIDPFALPLSVLFPDARLEDLQGCREDLDGTHVDFAGKQILLAVQSHVVRVGGKTVLIDTCVGEHKPRPRRADWDQRRATGYIASLAKAGFRPEDIDFVTCSHLHADHVGWNTVLRDGRWVPTFPRAQYVMGRSELSFWQEKVRETPQINHGCYDDSVLPVIEAGQCKTVEAGDSIADGATILPLPGHSPGQIGLSLSAGNGERAIVCGDALHSPAQVACPEWSSAFCDNPEQSTATRRSLLATAADENITLVPAHLRAAGMRIRRHAGGFRSAFCGCGG